MSFSCANYDFETDGCLMLKADCIPGRPGCVLAGKVKLSEALAARIEDLRGAGATKEREAGPRRRGRS